MTTPTPKCLCGHSIYDHQVTEDTAGHGVVLVDVTDCDLCGCVGYLGDTTALLWED